MKQDYYERKRKRHKKLMAAIDAGFWYTAPGEDGFICYRLYYRHSPLPDKCIGEFSHKRDVESEMLHRHRRLSV